MQQIQYRKLKIGVISARYSISGVPLAQARLARALARQGHQVDFIVGFKPGDLDMPIPEGTDSLVLNASSVKLALPKLIRYLRVEAPDIVFCAEDHLNATVTLAAIIARSRVCICGSSRVTPFDTYSSNLFSKKWFLKKFVSAVSSRQDVRTCVSQGTVEEYAKVMPSHGYEVAYNIVLQADIEERLKEPLSDPWLPGDNEVPLNGALPVIMGAGSLEPWKDFKSLILAVRHLHNQGRIVRLIILGEGSQRQELRSLISSLDLESYVRMPGRVTNPLRYFRRASVFALTSRVESFGNVLVEAMCAGTTPVATDCPTGPREVLQHGKYGYLVETGDPDSIAHGLSTALDKPIEKHMLQESVSRFTENAVLRRYEELTGIPLLRDGRRQR